MRARGGGVTAEELDDRGLNGGVAGHEGTELGHREEDRQAEEEDQDGCRPTGERDRTDSGEGRCGGEGGNPTDNREIEGRRGDVQIGRARRAEDDEEDRNRRDRDRDPRGETLNTEVEAGEGARGPNREERNRGPRGERVDRERHPRETAMVGELPEERAEERERRELDDDAPEERGAEKGATRARRWARRRIADQHPETDPRAADDERRQTRERNEERGQGEPLGERTNGGVEPHPDRGRKGRDHGRDGAGAEDRAEAHRERRGGRGWSGGADLEMPGMLHGTGKRRGGRAGTGL